jgi:hypothetical protein
MPSSYVNAGRTGVIACRTGVVASAHIGARASLPHAPPPTAVRRTPGRVAMTTAAHCDACIIGFCA